MPIDLAWFDVTWRANTDLDAVEFDLVDAEGMVDVGTPVNIPPVDCGGRIDYAGDSSWAGRKRSCDTRATDVHRVEDIAILSPLEGQTGLVSFHLRFDPDVLDSKAGASVKGVNATYTMPDGTVPSTTVDVPSTWRHCRGRQS